MTEQEHKDRVTEVTEKRRKLESLLLDYVERNIKDTTPEIAPTIPEVAKVLIELLH